MMNNILIIGGDSSIATHLLKKLYHLPVSVTVTSRRKQTLPAVIPTYYLDLDNEQSWSAILNKEYDLVFFFAGITSMRACVKQPDYAKKINLTNTVKLIRQLSQQTPLIIFPSTNQVFACDQPFIHWQQAFDPCSYYGMLKAKVEEQLCAINNISILRPTKILHRQHPLLQQFLLGQPTQAFCDHHIAPISINYFIDQLIHFITEPTPGIYQYSGSKDIDYYHFFLRAAQVLGRCVDNLTSCYAKDYDVKPLAFGSLATCSPAVNQPKYQALITVLTE